MSSLKNIFFKMIMFYNYTVYIKKKMKRAGKKGKKISYKILTNVLYPKHKHSLTEEKKKET